MADVMRMLGVGSWCSILALAVTMLGGATACSTGEAGAQADSAASGPHASGEGSTHEPEQVVQKIVGTGSGHGAVDRGGPVDRQGSLSAEPSLAGEGEASASAAGVSRSGNDALAPRANAAETITSKHLEAELNRLEAELAN